MPLTDKGRKIMSNMKHQYGKEKGKEVFYAMRNAHKITGVDKGFYGHMSVDSCRGKESVKCCEDVD